LYLRLVQKLNLPEFPKILGRTAAISPNRQALMNWVETPLMPVEQAQNDVGPILRAEPAHIEVDEPHVELIEAIEEQVNVVRTGTPNEFESVSLEPEVLDQQPIEVEEKKDDQVRPTAIELLPKHIQEKILKSREVRKQLADSLKVPRESNQVDEAEEKSISTTQAKYSGPESAVDQIHALEYSEPSTQDAEDVHDRGAKEVKLTHSEPAEEPSLSETQVASVNAKLSEEVEASTITPPTDKTALTAASQAGINLEDLPPIVRKQIERSRSAQAKLAEAGFASRSTVDVQAATEEQRIEPKNQPHSAVEPVEAPSNTTLTADQTDAVHEEKLLEAAFSSSTAVLDEDLTQLTPVEIEVTPADDLSESSAHSPAPNTPLDDSNEDLARESSEAEEPRVERSSPSQSSTPSQNLSAFAQFVASLESAKSAPKGAELIDQFLSVNPKISPLAKDAPAPEVRTEPDANVTGLVTETLARMYAEQGHVAKAIQAYEILKLRVPEKSSIFAARIEALKTK
jgi:hypothetical protein